MSYRLRSKWTHFRPPSSAKSDLGLTKQDCLPMDFGNNAKTNKKIQESTLAGAKLPRRHLFFTGMMESSSLRIAAASGELERTEERWAKARQNESDARGTEAATKAQKRKALKCARTNKQALAHALPGSLPRFPPPDWRRQNLSSLYALPPPSFRDPAFFCGSLLWHVKSAEIAPPQSVSA